MVPSRRSWGSDCGDNHLCVFARSQDHRSCDSLDRTSCSSDLTDFSFYEISCFHCSTFSTYLFTSRCFPSSLSRSFVESRAATGTVGCLRWFGYTCHSSCGTLSSSTSRTCLSTDWTFWVHSCSSDRRSSSHYWYPRRWTLTISSIPSSFVRTLFFIYWRLGPMSSEVGSV